MATIKTLYISAFDDLWERDYFQEAFGYECVDSDEVPGKLGPNESGWFVRELGKDIWPLEESVDHWDEDTFFDVVEAMHDLCSKGIEGYNHTYGNCGWHYDEFDREAGREAYRSVMNRILRRYERPMELDKEGHLVEAGPEDLRPLLGTPLPEGGEHDAVVKKTKAAIKLYRDRSSSPDDRRRAVRDLVDVVENLRPTIKVEALPKDEQELFKLANGFAIRHDNRNQLRQYDDKIWLSWAFWVYLATIHAVLRLKERNDAEQSS